MAGEKVMSGNARWTLDGKTVYHAQSCSLSFTRAVKERTSKDIEGRQVAKGIKSFSISISALAVYGSDGTATHDTRALFKLYNDDSDTRIVLEFIPDEADGNWKLIGEGIITDLSGDFANQEDGTSSMTIEGGAMVDEDIVVV